MLDGEVTHIRTNPDGSYTVVIDDLDEVRVVVNQDSTEAHQYGTVMFVPKSPRGLYDA